MEIDDFWNLWAGVILGAEGDEDQGNNDEDSNDDEDEEEDDESTDEPNGDNRTPSAEDLANLQKALEAERRVTRKLDRENKRLKATKAGENKEEQQTIETAQNREREATARAEKLASGLLQRDINAAIEKAARHLKFLDPEDAIAGVDRSKIEADQDEEDPTDIYVNPDTVMAAVKALAAKKPHYLSRGTDDGSSTGSTFGGKKRNKKNEDDVLRELYPSL